MQCRDLSATLTPATSRLEIGEWKLGSLRLPGLAGEEAPGMYEAKASIVHLFRIPDQRPPEVISIIFAGVAALPLLGLVYGLYQSDTNFKVSYRFLRGTISRAQASLRRKHVHSGHCNVVFLMCPIPSSYNFTEL
jgi:hypothetical protein